MGKHVTLFSAGTEEVIASTTEPLQHEQHAGPTVTFYLPWLHWQVQALRRCVPMYAGVGCCIFLFLLLHTVMKLGNVLIV
jgi:hypothetical protein